jgi:hypothetical protein
MTPLVVSNGLGSGKQGVFQQLLMVLRTTTGG